MLPASAEHSKKGSSRSPSSHSREFSSNRAVRDFVIDEDEDPSDDLEYHGGDPSPKERADDGRRTERAVASTTSYADVEIRAANAFKGSRRTLKAFLQACDAIIEEDSIPLSADLKAWFEEIRAAAQDPPDHIRTWSLTILLSVDAFFAAGAITWLVTQAVLPTVYMALGMGFGVFGMCKYQPESAAIGGILAKSMAWYLAPTLAALSLLEKYVLSVALAAFLEYPFLTFANAIAMKRKTAMRLRAIQDAVDVVATFIMVAVSGLGVVDVFTISQALLALLRVVVVTLGPKYCLRRRVEEASPAQTNTHGMSLNDRRKNLERIGNFYGKIATDGTNPEFDDWFEERAQELARLPKLSTCERVRMQLTWASLLCVGMTIVGVGLGAFGFTLQNDPYVLGISGVLGMGLAWYVGPSLKDRSFLFKWAVSVFLLTTLEYPFLSVANDRAAAMQETFELRAFQDLTGMIISTLLITVLSHVKLNRIDFLQLAIGVFRLAVVTRFFWTV